MCLSSLLISGGGIHKRKKYMENMSLKDNSGDKSYFTIIPNYILNHSTLFDREVYIQMKRFAGENKTCWVSRKNLAKQCGLSISRLSKSIKYLLEHNWIKKIGVRNVQTIGGIQEICEYAIVDLWNLNHNFYTEKTMKKNIEGRSLENHPDDKGRSPENQGGGLQKTTNNIYINKNKYIAKTSFADNEPLKKEEKYSKEIPLIFKEFEAINPAVKRMYGNKTQRQACSDLIEEYGFEKVIKVIKNTLPKTNVIEYMPTITTPLQLFQKGASLIAGINKLQNKEIVANNKNNYVG